jgi:putative two-component system response regulator
MPTTSHESVPTSPTTTLTSALLRRLVTLGVIPSDNWDKVSSRDLDQLRDCRDLSVLGDALLSLRLVTPFQAGRIRAGAINGLILGNYRVLEKIGSGGMGIVFRAEHVKLKNPVAIKALFVDGNKNRRHIERFFLEVRAVATLRHPNIVSAVDAGEEPHAGPDGQPVPYLVMEYVPGRNLDDLVSQEGPLPVPKACHIAHQIADALTESHRHGLIHRDIKPSNIILTADGIAKLLDFGVARLPSPENRLTQDGARLGTVGYMAPEQGRNPRDVDVRADVFGLAATLFFMLSGQDPFLPPGGAMSATKPPLLSDYRANISFELDEMLARMMSLDPVSRTASAAAAMRELSHFFRYDAMPKVPEIDSNRTTAMLSNVRTMTGSGLVSQSATIVSHPKKSLTATVSSPKPRLVTSAAQQQPTATSHGNKKATAEYRILIVDDEEPVRRVCRLALQHESMHCEEILIGSEAAQRGISEPFDLVLLDVDLPELNGELVLRKLRQQPAIPNQKIIMLSGRTSGDDLSRLLALGADDYLTKPFSVVQLRGRVKAALRLKEAQDRSDKLTRQLASSNTQLESALRCKASELVDVRGAIVLALARLVEQRSAETGLHLRRLQRYCRVLAEAAAATPAFKDRFDPTYVELIESAVPLHDIGKITVPDHVLQKAGKLTPEERVLVEAHSANGAQTLTEVAEQYPLAAAFFSVAVEIARYHHERWDGSGYPERLSGNTIPLPARLFAIADVYDALRCRRPYKAPMTHEEAITEMVTQCAGHFDPALFEVFTGVSNQFEKVFAESPE